MSKINPEFEASEFSAERPAWREQYQNIFEAGQAAERAKILEIIRNMRHGKVRVIGGSQAALGMAEMMIEGRNNQ